MGRWGSSSPEGVRLASLLTFLVCTRHKQSKEVKTLCQAGLQTPQCHSVMARPKHSCCVSPSQADPVPRTAAPLPLCDGVLGTWLRGLRARPLALDWSRRAFPTTAICNLPMSYSLNGNPNLSWWEPLLRVDFIYVCNTCANVYVDMCIYVCIWLCAYVYMYMCTHMYMSAEF